MNLKINDPDHVRNVNYYPKNPCSGSSCPCPLPSRHNFADLGLPVVSLEQSRLRMLLIAPYVAIPLFDHVLSVFWG